MAIPQAYTVLMRVKVMITCGKHTHTNNNTSNVSNSKHPCGVMMGHLSADPLPSIAPVC